MRVCTRARWRVSVFARARARALALVSRMGACARARVHAFVGWRIVVMCVKMHRRNPVTGAKVLLSLLLSFAKVLLSLLLSFAKVLLCSCEKLDAMLIVCMAALVCAVALQIRRRLPQR